LGVDRNYLEKLDNEEVFYEIEKNTERVVNMRLKDKDVYVYHNGKGLTTLNPSQYQYNGYTVYHLFQSLKTHEKDKKKDKSTIEKAKQKYPFIKGNTLRDVLENVMKDENTEIIEMNKHRYLLSVNDEGYIDNIIYGDYMLDGYDRLPEDISDGYYYINKGKIKKDKRKEEENGIFV